MSFIKLDACAIIPTRANSHAAGYDLYALKRTVITGGAGHVLVPTGVSVVMPDMEVYGRIAMRSGLAVKQHLTVSGGVIDRDYSGPLGVIVSCTKNDHEYVIDAGERFAQLVIERCYYENASNAGATNDTTSTQMIRGDNGFGSTGTK